MVGCAAIDCGRNFDFQLVNDKYYFCSQQNITPLSKLEHVPIPANLRRHRTGWRGSPGASEPVLLARVIAQSDGIQRHERREKRHLDHPRRPPDLDRAVHGGPVAHLGHRHAQ